MTQFLHASQINIIIALLQPAPETYELFDDILLMGEKKVSVMHVMPSCAVHLACLQCQAAPLCQALPAVARPTLAGGLVTIYTL